MSKTSKKNQDSSPLKRALRAIREMKAKIEGFERSRTEPIAIIGMGCRFPNNVNTPDEFWQLLRDGVDAITEIPHDRWDVDAYYDPDPEALGKMYTRCGGFLKDVDKFDPQFFGISPREAITMDPQQRLLLEVSWEALERAGLAADKLVGSRTGVFVGISVNDYSHLFFEYGDRTRIDSFTGTGNALCIAAGRLSYILGLQGPSLAVDTACSSSLVAVHLACQNLRDRKCRLALAGGVNLTLIPDPFIYLSRFRAISPDGRCKTFDASADGYGRGEGCGMVVLKRLSDAQADRDNILALILGSAINHDGRSSGLTVPNGQAQQAVIRDSFTDAGIDPLQVSYVEVHGTGTPLGDPIELRSLAAVTCRDRAQNERLVVGSVKTNFGHLESAAGIAGLMKTVLALQNQEIPANLHFKEPSPHITWNEMPISVPTTLTPMKSKERPHIAGVSSFGFSGTNAHVVLSEAPEPTSVKTKTERPLHLLTLSAKSKEALRELVTRFDQHLANKPPAPITHICYTANAGRTQFSHRLAMVGQSLQQFSEKLSSFTKGKTEEDVFTGKIQGTDRRKVAFLFTGQGSQFTGMGQQLYETQPTFCKTLELCDELLRPYLEQPLLSVIYPESGKPSPLDETAYTQPALFALEYALAELWRSWGIEPAVVLGHSVGEYVAACVAGLFSLEEGLKLIAERGRQMQALEHDGAMAAVFADEARVSATIEPFAETVSIAAVNGPENTVISGSREAVLSLLSEFEAEGIGSKQLKVSHAFHSPLMEPMLESFERVVGEIKFTMPRVGLVSNVTGRLIKGEEMTQSAYWREHVRKPVRFAASIEALCTHGYKLFLEIGPHPTLAGMGRRCVPDKECLWLPSLRKGKGDWQQLLESTAALYTNGVTIDWSGFDKDYNRRRVVLPTYPFQQKRYWFDGVQRDRYKTVAPSLEGIKATNPMLGYRLRSALKEIQFDNQYSSDSLPLLDDHHIYGMMVVPGSCHISTVLSAGAEVFGKGPYILEDVTFPQALIIPENEVSIVQLILMPEDTGRASFQLSSIPANTEEIGALWTLHASGKIHSEKTNQITPAGDHTNLEEVQRRCKKQQSYSDFFSQKTREIGLQLGPGFQWIGQTWHRNGEALCQMQIPQEVHDVDMYQIHPGLIDSCFQLLGVALLDVDHSSNLFVPIGFSSFRFYDRPGTNLWCHVLMRPGDWVNDEVISMDISLFDDEGRIVAEVENAQFKQAPREALLRATLGRFDHLLYEVSWKSISRKTPDTAIEHDHPNRTGNWMIFTDGTGVGSKLAALLKKAGESCIMVFPGKGYECFKRGHYRINPLSPEDFKRLLDETLSRDESPYLGIIHLWSLDFMPSDQTTMSTLKDDQALGCGSILHLVQQLVKADASVMPRLWLVTRGAQPVGSELVSLAVAQSPLWGLGRVIALEHPEMWGGLIDLPPDPDVSEDESSNLLAEIRGSEKDDHIAFRQGHRYIARVIRVKEQAITGEHLSFQDDCSYLITGGMGALGIEISRWMVEEGARYLVLVGRSGPSDFANEVLTQLEHIGAKVLVARGDVSKEEDVERILTQISQSMPPLRGIIHAAGVLDVGVLVQQDWTRFAKVMASKVEGAWNLHIKTLDRTLDFFVLFSSVASLLGSAGQGNYAAANAFLDTLAHHRRIQGLPALSINWGAWDKVGMAASMTGFIRDQMIDRGFSYITPNIGLQVLKQLMWTNAAQIAVAPVDWSKTFESFPEGIEPPLLAEMAREAQTQKETEHYASNQDELKRQLVGAIESERQEILLNLVRAHVSKLLRFDPSEHVDIKKPLNYLGFDSIMAIELKNSLQTQLGVVIPIAQLLQGSSIVKLTELLQSEFSTSDIKQSVSSDRSKVFKSSIDEGWEEGEI